MPNLSQTIVSTMWSQSDDIADEVMRNNAILAVLEDKGLIKRKQLGYEIRRPVMSNDTPVGGFYAGYSAFNMDATNDLDAFQFAIKQCYEPITISGREKRANQGEDQIIDLIEVKMKAATSRLKNTVATSLTGDGTAFGGLEFDGIKKMVSSTPNVGTYGRVDRATNPFARNVAVTGVTFTAANIQEYITDAITSVTRGAQGPDLAIAGKDAWKFLHSSLTAIQRISAPTNKAVAGFRRLEYDGVEIINEGGFGGNLLDPNSIRLFTTDYLEFDLQKGADFKPLESEMERPIDQDAFFNVIIVEGNLTCSAPVFNVYVGT